MMQACLQESVESYFYTARAVIGMMRSIVPMAWLDNRSSLLPDNSLISYIHGIGMLR